MPAPMAPAARQAAPARSQQAAQPPIRFTRASRQKSMLAFQTPATNLAASGPVAMGPLELIPAGFLRYIELDVTGTAAGNSATVAFAADAPFNVLQQVGLTNAAGDTIIVPISGFNLYLLNKYGALSIDPPNCDPRRSPEFSTTTGAGTTGGSFRFTLRIPLEVDSRDAFCALSNQAANKSYQLSFSLSPTSVVYTTAPTNLPSISIVATMHFWHAPDAANAAGYPQQTAPSGNGSVSLWRTQQIPITPNSDTFNQLTNVGNVVRSLIFVCRHSSGARQTNIWPNIFQFVVNNDVWLYETIAALTRDMAQSYGYTGTIDTAGGLDTGVYALPYTLWTGSGGVNQVRAGNNRDLWLPTLDATFLQIHASQWGANANLLEVLTNEIKPNSAAGLYNQFTI